MKFKFTIQPYQTEAVNSVVNVFAGQPYQDNLRYRRDIGKYKVQQQELYKQDDLLYTGFANAPVMLNQPELLRNIKNVQQENNLKLSSSLENHLGCCALDVEMETGTGKTYVYIKTMFELNKHYGWSKFIVVVPSIAIREGVRKSFVTMEDHFMEYYGKKARFFVYDSKNLTDIDQFSSSADLSVMIINVQAFNARGKDARRIRMELESFGSRMPIEVIQANRPIVILDEPQKMGGEKTQESLKEFNPLFTLNYSATHRVQHNKVYALDSLDAYRMKLVKKIRVNGIEVKNLQGTNCYLYLEGIEISPNKPPRARLEFEIKHKTGIKRETKLLDVGDNLYYLSNDLEQYKGYVINTIDPLRNCVTFTKDDIEIHTGNVQGDVSEKDIRRAQIRETIRAHLRRESELYPKGIKTLSLFFIDKVENYRKYDEDGNEINSEYGEMFEEEYTRQVNEYISLFDTPYSNYLKSIDVHATHAGYFSIDKKGHKVDSKVGKGKDISDDESAYDLILKDKERLLSFDTPVRFIFSHSALREGWDNPNVFQICTLKHGGDSTTNKRQEVGRGLRLCVNQQGDRMDVHQLGDEVQTINQLTVIASEGYDEYVRSLQKEISDNLVDRPTQATIPYFEGKTVSDGEKKVTLDESQARLIYRYLIKNDYIDENDHITQTYHDAVENKTLVPLPEKIRNMTEDIQKLIQGVYDPHAMDNMFDDATKPQILENKLNDNFKKKEFQELWNDINHKYTYRVDFDSQELIDKAIKHINDKLFVTRLKYIIVSGDQVDDATPEDLKAGLGFKTRETNSEFLNTGSVSQVKYDLIGKIAAGTNLTRRTVVAILKKIEPVKFAMFKMNPEEFITKVSTLINEEKATMIVEHITYNKTDGKYDSDIFTAEKNKDFDKAYRAQKNVQDYVFADGTAEKPVERKFAEAMDVDGKVIVYAKLPRGFQIPTPVGNYAPDWAIAFEKGSVKHIFFVAETKGTMDSLNLRPIEQAKISCASKLFKSLSTIGVVYHDVDSYEKLLDIMGQI